MFSLKQDYQMGSPLKLEHNAPYQFHKSIGMCTTKENDLEKPTTWDLFGGPPMANQPPHTLLAQAHIWFFSQN